MARKLTTTPVYTPVEVAPTCGTCLITAICKIKVDGVWKNVCERCYLAHFQKQADDYRESQGIITLEQKRQYVRDKARGIYRMREPGE